MKLALAILSVLLGATSAFAVKVDDITRIDGQRVNKIVGLGLITGLKGTGDGSDYAPAVRPLAQMLNKLGLPVTAKDVEAKNVALVVLTATLPPDGVRNGDAIDVYVASTGGAASLRGGRLFTSILHAPRPMEGGVNSVDDILAVAEGAVLLEDPSTPTVGVIKKGAVLEQDLPAHYITGDTFTLVIDDPSASWTTASTIAKIVNDAESLDGQPLAFALDPKTVVVQIPPNERATPDSFISRVQLLPVRVVPTEARVTVNERTGTMIVTGDVEISPVVISHKGLTITTVTPEPVPTPRAPVVNQKGVVALDTTQAGGTRLQDLVNALDQLKVPSEDRIAIVKELHKTGKLHGKLIIEGNQ